MCKCGCRGSNAYVALGEAYRRQWGAYHRPYGAVNLLLLPFLRLAINPRNYAITAEAALRKNVFPIKFGGWGLSGIQGIAAESKVLLGVGGQGF